MPVVHRQGDLLAAPVDVLFHGCNCFNTMGAGIAPLIARAYPKAYEVDQGTQRGSREKLGWFTIAQDTKIVYNLYTQYHPGPDFRLWSLMEALYAMKNDLVVAEQHAGKRLTVGGPRIGCGIGGGNWDEVEAVINIVFPDRDIYIYTL